MSPRIFHGTTRKYQNIPFKIELKQKRNITTDFHGITQNILSIISNNSEQILNKIQIHHGCSRNETVVSEYSSNHLELFCYKIKQQAYL
jgi:hypothetical protein